MSVPLSITDTQRQRLEEYSELLAHFNRRINLISPNTAGDIWARHIEHSLSLALHGFESQSMVVDWGTGGGLPVVPLAVCFPEVHFTAVDAVGKKVQAVRAMVRNLKLPNVELWHGRAEEWPGKTHYSISRATAPLRNLWRWHKRVAEPLSADVDLCWRPGLLCLKGGNLSEEFTSLKEEDHDVTWDQIPLDTLLSGPIYSEKYIVHVVQDSGRHTRKQ